MLRSDLCDYSDAYIAVKGTITLIKTNGGGIRTTHHLLIAYQKSKMY